MYQIISVLAYLPQTPLEEFATLSKRLDGSGGEWEGKGGSHSVFPSKRPDSSFLGLIVDDLAGAERLVPFTNNNCDIL